MQLISTRCRCNTISTFPLRYYQYVSVQYLCDAALIYAIAFHGFSVPWLSFSFQCLCASFLSNAFATYLFTCLFHCISVEFCSIPQRFPASLIYFSAVRISSTRCLRNAVLCNSTALQDFICEPAVACVPPLADALKRSVVEPFLNGGDIFVAQGLDSEFDR